MHICKTPGKQHVGNQMQALAAACSLEVQKGAPKAASEETTWVHWHDCVELLWRVVRWHGLTCTDCRDFVFDLMMCCR